MIILEGQSCGKIFAENLRAKDRWEVGVAMQDKFFRNDVRLQWRRDLVLLDTCAIYTS